MEKELILAINPGSTSTKIAVYKGEEEVKSTKIEHSKEELQKYERVIFEYVYRLELIIKWLDKEGIDINSLKAVVGRGGPLRPIPGGTYLVTQGMIEDLRNGVGAEHAANLGGLLAKGVADMAGVDAFIVDPISVDEFEDVARISGLKDIERKSQIHALNVKAVSYRRAEELNRDIKDLNFIVAHLGGGISIVSVKGGLMIDVNNASEMGPFSPERTGELPTGDLVKLCYSGKYTFDEMKRKIKGEGGLMSYLGTIDAKKIENRIDNGDKYAKLIYDAMIYQIGKEIGRQAAVLRGQVDNIILTGGLSHSDYIVRNIKSMVSFIAEVITYPGEDEMGALNRGVLRVLEGKEKLKIYEEEASF